MMYMCYKSKVKLLILFWLHSSNWLDLKRQVNFFQNVNPATEIGQC